MTRVLVTGAGGFVGSHLATGLDGHGHEVVALDLDLSRVRHLEAPGRFTLLQGDLTDPEVRRRAVAGVDTVFHLAAAHLAVTVPQSEYRRVNVEAVRSLMQDAAAAGVRRFVHCSSVGVYGPISDPPADENTPCRPRIAYETTKLHGEEAVLEAARSDGFPAVVLRPVWVYGPGCGRTEKLFRAIGRRRFVMAGDGRGLRHCVYVDDMVRAFRLAADAPDAVGQVIVVGDAEPVPVRTLLGEIARLSGVPPPPSVPVPLLYLAGALAELIFKPMRREPPVSRRTVRFFTGNTAFDISRARQLLGFEPRYDLRQGLEETYRNLQNGTVR